MKENMNEKVNENIVEKTMKDTNKNINEDAVEKAIDETNTNIKENTIENQAIEISENKSASKNLKKHKHIFKSKKRLALSSVLVLSIVTSLSIGTYINKSSNNMRISKEPITNCFGKIENEQNMSQQHYAYSSGISAIYDNCEPSMNKSGISQPSSGLPNVYQSPSTFSKYNESDFIHTTKNPVSTFSSDIDKASYVTLRQFANSGRDLAAFQTSNILLRTEEVLNYFTYNYKAPAKNETFSITSETSICPWNKNNTLVHIGIKAKELESSTQKPLNLVFLIDVSGSMSDKDKLPLLQKSLSSLVNKLNKNDTISIVTYANDTKIVLNKANGSQKNVITKAINSLESGGGTNGGNGLATAYKLAKQNFNKKSNNRIILATDGDFNFGMTSTDDLEKYISKQKNAGIYLSVLGFGSSYNDAIMETLADNGNGNYNIIDTVEEAKKVLQSEFLGTMYTVAEDVKFQVTFDPKEVSQYRLIGYENRVMNTEDFDDDTKDAGDMGAGQAVTIVYEIVGSNEGITNSSAPIKLDIRYKEPATTKSNKLSHSINTTVQDSISSDMQFIAAAIETVMVLNNSKYLDINKRSLSEIKHDLKYINLNQSQKDFYNTVSMLCDNTTSYMESSVDEYDIICN